MLFMQDNVVQALFMQWEIFTCVELHESSYKYYIHQSSCCKHGLDEKLKTIPQLNKLFNTFALYPVSQKSCLAFT